MPNMEILECEHAKRLRANGKKPNMANELIPLGETDAGNPVILHVCIDCWRVITGVVMERIAILALRKEGVDMGHKHIHCEHSRLAYCRICDVVYCLDCDREWVKPTATITWGSSGTYTTKDTYTVTTADTNSLSGTHKHVLQGS